MQNFSSFRLAEIIAQRGADKANELLNSDFRCDKNADVERFLLKNAVRFEQAKMTRTHLLFDEDTGELVAYFSLSFKSITVNVTKSRLKKLTGGLTNTNNINVFLIAQIGKNTLIENNPIRLEDILDFSLSSIKVAQNEIGGKVAVLECENNEKLISYYEKHGFSLIDTADEDELKTMFIIPEF